MPRRNRVDPWGDLHAVSPRGLFTGNRGCVVNDQEQVVRHHGSALWITCVTEFRGWRWPLARPRRWTPLFFLDDAVALAAGHRPCATCRRRDYLAYRDAVTLAVGAARPLRAWELNARLQRERLHPGRGLSRAKDRMVWTAAFNDLPEGTVVIGANGSCELFCGNQLLRYGFAGWTETTHKPPRGMATVLTPPTSVAALAHGFRPVLHASAHASMVTSLAGTAEGKTFI